MSIKNYTLISGALFAIVALAHVLRLLQGWEIVVAGWTVPMWVSVIGLIVTGLLAFFGLRFGARGV